MSYVFTTFFIVVGCLVYDLHKEMIYFASNEEKKSARTSARNIKIKPSQPSPSQGEDNPTGTTTNERQTAATGAIQNKRWHVGSEFDLLLI